MPNFFLAALTYPVAFWKERMAYEFPSRVSVVKRTSWFPETSYNLVRRSRTFRLNRVTDGIAQNIVP